jgi:hypothetical protein
VKSPAVEDLSPPKSSTATALFALLELYINAPRAVIVAVVHVLFAKSTNAVVPDSVIAAPDKIFPPAVYPVATTSSEVEYMVVAALSVAEEV